MAENDITIKQILDTINAFTASNAAMISALNTNTLETTKNTQAVAANTAAVQALTAKITGGVVVPPVDPPPVEPPPTTAQKWGVQGRKFTKDGVVIPFLKGANCRPIAFHIENTPEGERIHVLPGGDDVNYHTKYAHITDVNDTINLAQAMGCHVMRIYAPIMSHQNGQLGTNIDYCLRRVNELVNYISYRGMGTLIVLNCTSSPFHVYPAPSNIDWYKTGYKKEYLDFVTAFARAFKDNQNVFGFEVGNEFHSYQPFGTVEAEIMLAFMGDMASRIKAIAPNRLVLPGNETSHQLFSHQKVNYFQRYLDTAFDALSLHLYDPSLQEPLGVGTKLGDNANQAANYELAQTEKPVYVGEFGISRVGHSLNAAEPTRKFLALAKSLGIAGVFQWAVVQARQEGGNIGWHDAASLDNCEHTHDFQQLAKVWADFS